MVKLLDGQRAVPVDVAAKLAFRHNKLTATPLDLHGVYRFFREIKKQND